MNAPSAKQLAIALAVTLVVGAGLWLWLEPYSGQFDASYVGSDACGECHTLIHAEWERSPHANMTRRPTLRSVVGDFEDGSWTPPPGARAGFEEAGPVARMYREGDRYFMALRRPDNGRFQPFEIAYVIGYQYRQVYLTQEPGGVLRRLPLQWSVPLQTFFPYWNLQEGSQPTVPDLWAQMTSLHSAWNLYCARCHTTHLVVEDKDVNHRRASVHWVDDGIACEACHGPGSLHAEYFGANYANRIVAFLNSKLRGQPVAYIANAQKLDKGRAMSVCARCHGADIFMTTTDLYRIYEPGYSREGRINDLSGYFRQAPLEPGRRVPTVEVYPDGRPEGIGMLFRSLIESACYQEAEIRCYDCHNPHDNKQPAAEDILHASDASDRYCLGCHEALADDVQAHTRHPAGGPGSHCYDCHMPRSITKLATGRLETTRTHRMSSIPDPARTLRYGPGGSPNACGDCHEREGPAWAARQLGAWFPAAPTAALPDR